MWTRSSGILLAFLTIPPKHVGPCMLSPRRNALPKSSPTPRAPLHRHTLEFGTITNSQHLRSRSFFFAQTTLNVVSKDPVASGSTNSLPTRNVLQSRPCGLSKLVPTSLVRRSLSLRTPAFSSLKKNASRPLASSTHPLLHSTFLEWTFLPTQTRILLPGSPRLQDGLPPHHQQNKCRWSHLHELWTGPF